MSEILFRNFQLLDCCGLLHQLPVTEISVPFCHSVHSSPTAPILSNYKKKYFWENAKKTMDGPVFWNSNGLLTFIICRPRKTNFRFPFPRNSGRNTTRNSEEIPTELWRHGPWTWIHGNETRRHGDVETWRYGHGDLEPGRHRHMETWSRGGIDTWRHGHTETSPCRSGNLPGLQWTASPEMGCHLGCYFTAGCPLRGGRGDQIQKRVSGPQKTPRKKHTGTWTWKMGHGYMELKY